MAVNGKLTVPTNNNNKNYLRERHCWGALWNDWDNSDTTVASNDWTFHFCHIQALKKKDETIDETKVQVSNIITNWVQMSKFKHIPWLLRWMCLTWQHQELWLQTIFFHQAHHVSLRPQQLLGLLSWPGRRKKKRICYEMNEYDMH